MSMTSTPASRAPWLAYTILCSAFLMIVIDISIISMALPSIQRDLGFSQSGLAWATNAYTIAYGGLLLLSGRLGDLVGRKLMFLGGLPVFAVGSLLCGVSVNQTMLITSRFVQGIGAAMAIAVVVAIIFTLFQDPADRAKAVAGLTFVSAGGATVGIVLGGIITEAISWRWVFFINVPIAVVAFILAGPLVPADRGMGVRQGVDLLSALLVTAGLMMGVYTIVEVPNYGWVSAHTLGFGALALTMLVTFVMRQNYVTDPLMPLRLFRSRNLSGANLVQFLQMAGVFGFNFLGALYLQEVVGYKPAVAGSAFLPLAAIMGVASVALAPRMSVRFGPRNVVLAGLVLCAASLLLAARTPLHPNYAVDVLPMALLLGAGAGLSIPVEVILSMSVTNPRDAGLASGMFGTSAMAGSAFGLAILATLAQARTKTLLAAGQHGATAINGGLHLAFLVSAGIVLLGTVAALLLPGAFPAPPRPPASEPPIEEPAASQPGYGESGSGA